MSEDLVRVLRIIEYSGPRSEVERAVEMAVHGAKRLPRGLVITAATLGNYPEILPKEPISDFTA